MIYRILIAAPEKSATVYMSYILPFSENPDISWSFVFEQNLCSTDIVKCDVLILFRCFQGSSLSMVRLARKRGVLVIYELDDDLLHLPDDEVWGRFWINSQLSKVVRLFLAESTVVKTGSKELARRLCAQNIPSVFFPYAVKPFAQPEPLIPPFRIGYFGSAHHQKDIEIILPSFHLLEQRYPREIVFEFFGCRPEGWSQIKNVQTFPYITDYPNFLSALSERRWALGLAPLRNTPFNRAKSDSKFRDFSAVGVLGVYTKIAPYLDSVIEGRTGWFAGDDPEEWMRFIVNALFNSNRELMLQEVREQIEKNNHPEIIANHWLNLLDRLQKGIEGDELCLAR